MVELVHVSKDYATGPRALSDVTLQVEKGRFVYLTGCSGAGKSTLLKLLYAAERPSEGEVRVNGFEVHRLKRRRVPLLRRSLGVVFQDMKLLPRRTALENVAFALEVLGARWPEARKRSLRALHQVGMERRENCYPAQLSAGEQQRVAIARAVINEPPLILADEPTGNIDPEATEGILQLFADINLRGATVILATHSPLLPSLLPRERFALNQGRLTGAAGLLESSTCGNILSARPGKI